MTARVIIIAAASLSIVAACPPDLDAQLIARTGCGAHEIEQLLDAGPDRVALALLPLLDGEMELGDLAAMVASDPGAVDAVRELYQSLPPVAPAAEPLVIAVEPPDVPPIETDPPAADPDQPAAAPVGDTTSDEVPE